jgi:murein DD-endopeptidase MepM/ murein hydrolase activator NlpD
VPVDIPDVTDVRRPARRVLAPALTAVVLLAGSTLHAAPAGAESVAEARAAAERLRAELIDLRARSAESILRLEAAEDALAGAVTAAATLGREVDEARAEADGTDARLHRRVSALYRSGGGAGLWATLLHARDPQDLVARKRNLDAIVAADAHVRDVAQAGSGQLESIELQAEEYTARTVAAEAVAEAETAQLNALLARQTEALAAASDRVLAAVEDQRRAEAAEAARVLAAQQAAALRAAVSLGTGFGTTPNSTTANGTPVRGTVDLGNAKDVYIGPAGVCPVGPAHSFTDTWHAPRSGGRKHQGTDVFAPWGSPAYAVVDGVIDKVGNGGLGGITLWLRGKDGDRYYYAHNAANVATVGQRVRAGDVIAYVGKTGNAETTPPHIHFEAHPGGGVAANPAPWLAALCAG